MDTCYYSSLNWLHNSISDGRLTGLTSKLQYFNVFIIILHHLLITRLLQYCQLSRYTTSHVHFLDGGKLV